MFEVVRSTAGEVVAIVVKKDFMKEGVNFVSEEDFPLQLGISCYKKGDRIRAHFHLKREVKIDVIQEVVHVESGSLKVDLYDSNGGKIRSVDLSTGDTVFFVSGGHGFQMCENVKLIEVKQGPYFGKDSDKKLIE
jgi:hypothetical protein